MRLFERSLDRADADYASLFVEGQPNWILVEKGSLEALREALLAYAALCVPERPQPCTIGIGSHPDGFLVVTFPEDIPPYAFVNLIGWLHSPPNIADVSGATGWLRSPGTGVRYALYPGPMNAAGDTLIGYGDDNQTVSVYLPEASLSLRAESVEPRGELDLGDSGVEDLGPVGVVLDADWSFGNPDFVIGNT